MKRLLIAVLAVWIIAVPSLAQADETYRLRVDGLACPFCAYGIEKKLSAVTGVKKIDVLINKGVVVVIVASGARFDRDLATKAVKAAGFTLRGFERMSSGG